MTPTSHEKPQRSSDPMPGRLGLSTRLLVQTRTHLIPQGKTSVARENAMLDAICSFYWGCAFECPKFRFATYDVEMAFDNQRCFFLVDHGETDDDDKVPVACYEWGGSTMIPLPQLAEQRKVRRVLKHRIPFTYSRMPPRKPLPVRERVRGSLRNLEYIHDKDITYLLEHPEDLGWLKAHVDSKMMQSFMDQKDCMMPEDLDDLDWDNVIVEPEVIEWERQNKIPASHSVTSRMRGILPPSPTCSPEEDTEDQQLGLPSGLQALDDDVTAQEQHARPSHGELHSRHDEKE